MQVENYSCGYDAGWNWGPRLTPATISKRAYTRLIREARNHFDGFGIDFSQYDEGKATFRDMIIASVTWTHRRSGKTITLLEIWFDKKTGAINQCGRNYGDLVS